MRTHLNIPFRLRYGIFGYGLGLRLKVSLIPFGVRPCASLQKSHISPLKANGEMGSTKFFFVAKCGDFATKQDFLIIS